MTFDIRGVQEAQPVGHLLDKQSRRRWIRLHEHACLRVSAPLLLGRKVGDQGIHVPVHYFLVYLELVHEFHKLKFASLARHLDPAKNRFAVRLLDRRKVRSWSLARWDTRHLFFLLGGLGAGESFGRPHAASRRMQHLLKSTSADETPAQPELDRFARKEQA